MTKKNKSGISKSPWKMVKFPAAKGEDWRIVEDANKKVVGEIQHVGNALLIESAPDLLRCAENALRELQDLNPMSSYASALQAAIIKARGH